MTTLMTVRGACPHDCPDTCAWIATVEVGTGRAVALRGNPDHPVTCGVLCAKVNHYLERTYHPERVLYPLRRVGPKGSGTFTRITWEEALSEVATRLTDVIQRHGAEAILPYSYAGTMGLVQGSSMDRRFFHALGASRLDRTICAEAGWWGYVYTIGATVGVAPEDFAHARLILLWGTNTLTSNAHLWPFIHRARKRGARVIVIDPMRTQTARQADWWLPVVPGTDAALALGMMHVIVRDGLWDRDYVDRYTLGFDHLRERLEEWPPPRAAAITGIPPEAIEELARTYAATRPAVIRVNYGLQRHAGGGMATRAIASLPALVGAWRDRGGGILLSTSGAFAVNREALVRPDLQPHPTRLVNMIRLGDALDPDPRVRARATVEGSPDVPVMALVVYNSNPAAVAPDQNAVLRGLAREDLFTVVLEHFLTDTANYADVVLPATTQLEHWDLHTAYGHYYLTLNQPAIAPVGESKPNSEIFRLLARHMGLDHPCFADSDLDLIQQALDSDHPWLAGITFERLREEGFVRLNLPDPFLPFAAGHFPTPSGKCEFYSARAARDGFDPLPTFIPPREVPLPGGRREPALPGHWSEMSGAAEVSLAAEPGGAMRPPETHPPLALLSPPAHNFLNSTFANLERMRRREGEPYILLHPTDAAERGVREGQWVKVWNRRGALHLRARVGEDVRPGVCLIPSTWWRKFSPDGQGVNVLTSQEETDMGGTATFYDTAVWVEPDTFPPD